MPYEDLVVIIGNPRQGRPVFTFPLKE